MTIDVIIMITEDHIPLLKKMVPYCKKNIDVNSVYVIANKNIEQCVKTIEGVEFVDEESIFPGLNLLAVQGVIETISGERKRAGWYLQQFLKMAWSYYTDKSFYVSLDADTFVLNSVKFINDEGKYLFTPKIEYHQPYFDSLERLFNGKVKKCVNHSFIAENMIFDVKIMREMIETIDLNNSLNGKVFWEKILYSVNKQDITASGFSEFETYGNYIYSYYPERVMTRKLRTMREALVLLGGNPSVEQLEWASKDYDIISIESTNYKKTIVTWLTRKKFFRKYISMKDLARVRHKFRTAYRKIIGKNEIEFEVYD